MFSRMVFVIVLLAMALAVSACGGESDEDVVASFYPLAFAAEWIVEEGATVRNLTPAGAEPHDLELTASDVTAIQSASLVLYLGQGFQPAVEEAVSGRDGASLDALEGQELAAGEEAHGHGAEEGGEHEGEEALDPHVWLDPSRFAAMARAIGEALGRPERGDELATELEALDREFSAGLAGCERREIVTSHAAFGYLARRYDLTQIALAGLTPEAEPSPKALAGLVEEVEEEGATTVFFETLVSPDLARTVAAEAGATVAVLNPLEGLTEDDLAAGKDYFSVMRENLSALRTALGCR